MIKKAEDRRTVNWHRPLEPNQKSQRYLRKKNSEGETLTEGGAPSDPALGWDGVFDCDTLEDPFYWDADPGECTFHQILGLLEWEDTRTTFLNELFSGIDHSYLSETLNDVPEFDIWEADPEAPNALANRLSRFVEDCFSIDGSIERLIPKESLLNPTDWKNLHDVMAAGNPSVVIMILFSRFWIRKPSDWPGRGTSSESESASLAGHLFLRHEVPECLRDLWVDLDHNRVEARNVSWYILLGQGASLHRVSDRFHWSVTKKFTHFLFQVSGEWHPELAPSCAEVLRFGGSENLAQWLIGDGPHGSRKAVFSNQPGKQLEKNFWEAGVRWLVGNEDEIEEAGDGEVIWDFAYHRFLESQRGGAPFRWSGRSLERLREAAREYQDALTMSRFPPRRELKWESKGWDWSDFDEASEMDWKMVELTTTSKLLEEGRALRHCVGTYDWSCKNGASAIFSLRANEERVATIQIELGTRKMTQARGKYNRTLRPKELGAVKRWLSVIN